MCRVQNFIGMMAPEAFLTMPEVPDPQCKRARWLKRLFVLLRRKEDAL
jgi:hypothetical protein